MSKRHQQSEALLEIWEVLSRHRWRFILPAFVVMTTLLAASLFLPRKYKAEATFERRTDMVLAEMLSRGVSQKFVEPKQSLNNEIAGQPAIDGLVKSLESNPEHVAYLASKGMTPDDVRDIVDRKIILTHDITSSDLDRIRVSYIGEDPFLSRIVINTLVENYIERTREVMEQRLSQSAAFFKGEVDRTQSLIEKLENTKLEFEVKNGDLLPDSPTGITSQLDEAEEQLQEAQRLLEAATSAEAAISKQLKNTEKTIPVHIREKNPDLARLEAKLREMREKLNLYVGSYKMTEKHPDVRDLRLQIEETEKLLKDTPTEVISQTQIATNPKLAELELMLTRAQADRHGYETKVRQINASIAKLKTQAKDVFPIRSQYREITREVDQAHRQLAFWEDNLRRVELAVAAESGDKGIRLDFIKPCGELKRPVSPHLMQILMAAIGLGLVGGAISVFLAHRADETFSSGESIANAFDLPMIGTVSEIISRRQRRIRRLKNLIVYPTGALAMAIVLVTFSLMLYLNLEKPEVFNRLKHDPQGFWEEHVDGTNHQHDSADQE